MQKPHPQPHEKSSSQNPNPILHPHLKAPKSTSDEGKGETHLSQPNEHSKSDSGEPESDSSESDSSPQKPINPMPKATPSPLKSSIEPSNNEKGSKRKGKASNETVNMEGEPAKKKLFQRLWNEDDEITILKGMVEFIEKGRNPIADKEGFKSFINESIHIKFSRKQMKDKISKLKKKYERHSKRVAEGKVLMFTHTHQKNSYHLSEKIWGVAGALAYEGDSALLDLKAGSSCRNSKVRNVTVDYDFLHYNMVKNLNMKYYDESLLKKGVNLIESAKARSLEERWKKLQLIEMDIYRQRSILIKEEMDVIFDGLGSSL